MNSFKYIAIFVFLLIPLYWVVGLKPIFYLLALVLAGALISYKKGGLF